MALGHKSKNKPYRTGYFPVGQGHELYYELVGNPRGIPVVHLHGGPGAGFPQKDRGYYNPKRFNVLLFDQRGSSHSRPLASTKNNTTWKLVEDIEKLMDFVGFQKAIFVGGSWGSMLALVFAIKHPKRVAGLIVRGIHLANQFSRNHFYFGGIQSFFPEQHEKFFSLIPKRFWKQPEKYYFQKITSKNKKTSQKYRHAWVELEDSCISLESEKPAQKRLNQDWAKSFATIGSYYLANNCFLPENYILKNAYKLKKIPTIIINGRYDMVCPPLEAFELHKAISGSELVFTIAGHAGHEKQTYKAVVKALNQMAKKVKNGKIKKNSKNNSG